MANQVIAILGAGNVGMALARAFVAGGESIIFGVPDPDKYRIAVAALGPVASIGSTGAAVAASDLVIMATPYSAALSVAGSVPDWGRPTRLRSCSLPRCCMRCGTSPPRRLAATTTSR